MQVTREVAETALPDYSRSGSHDSRILDEKLWILRTRDMSNSGVFLERDGQQCPPVGTELEVRISGPVGGGGAPAVVRARVVRVTCDAMAVVFIPA